MNIIPVRILSGWPTREAAMKVKLKVQYFSATSDPYARARKVSHSLAPIQPSHCPEWNYSPH